MQSLTTPPGSPGGAGSSDEGALLAGATDDGAVRVSCEVCGKLYKNIGSYHNHRWEHRYGWDLTRQYAKTKKDRVELMEGAALLMNVTAVTGVSGAL